MAIPISEGSLLWEPSEAFKKQTNLVRYMHWLEEKRGLHFEDSEALWRWSVEDLEAFWSSIWEFFEIKASQPYTQVLGRHEMPGAEWFPGAKLNYAEHIFRNMTDARPAILYRSEQKGLQEISWTDLHRQVSGVAAALCEIGVRTGDRVVAYLPNIPQAIIAFLACASLGATWSSCSPDFGTSSVIDRFAQIEPTVLFTIDGYQYGGKSFDRRPMISGLQQVLPTLKKTVLVHYLFEAEPETIAGLSNTVLWTDLLETQGTLTFEQVPFEHPLWILYSSGTTGLPKPIVQSQGGILLEQLKGCSFSLDLKPEDHFFWFTTTGWMMWNVVVSALLSGATTILYDGSPSYPNMGAIWELAEKSGMTIFGTSGAYILSCMKAGIEPGQMYDLSHLKAIGSTGSPLPPEGFQWVYEHVRPDIWLISTSGGTDVCSSFVSGNPLKPVYAGEIQARALGVGVQAFNELGAPLIDEVGELVITKPMPSMPIAFWNDPDRKRYQESYFEMFPGIWRHGDWIKITPTGEAIIYGRSDSTINRMGVRMGSSEIYRAVEDIPEVLDSLILGIERSNGGYYMPLFVVLKPGSELTEDLQKRIKQNIRGTVSPHHVPDEIIVVPEIPRTLNGKKLEVPIKRLLMGVAPEKAVNMGAVGNPQSMQFFLDFAKKHPV